VADGTVGIEMYRFLARPRWIAFHLLVIVAIIAMINLGFWQLRRLDERKEFNAEVTERSELPPVPLDDLLADPDFDPATSEWRPVSTAGTWLPSQVLIFNRTQAGAAGDNVLTALVSDDGQTVLVNRGFVPLGAEVPDPPATETAVLGRVRLSQSRQTGQLTDAAEGPLNEVRRVELDRLAPQFGGEIAPIYLDLIESVPAVTSADPVPVPAPQLGEGNHLSYAFQWFIFAICVLIGWVLAVRRSIRTRRAAAEATADASADASADSLAG
jgi:cytochrome oxidase assembly protein ShyY1